MTDSSRNHDGEVETLWTGKKVRHRFIEAAGLNWHFAETGDPANETIVFIHGMPECWYTWHHQITELDDQFHCIAIDTKGFGQSDHRLDSDYDYAAQAAELVQLFDALGLDRFFLVSHDRGTVIADHLCATDGMEVRIRRYVRMQQSGNRPHSEPRPPHHIFNSEAGVEIIRSGALIDAAYGLEPIPWSDERLFLVGLPIDRRDIERFREEVTQPGVAESMAASFISADFDQELEDRMTRLFATMTMPVLFLQGALDPGMQTHEYENVTDAVANGHLEFIQAGHFLQLEDPPAVTASIRTFLTRNDL